MYTYVFIHIYNSARIVLDTGKSPIVKQRDMFLTPWHSHSSCGDDLQRSKQITRSLFPRAISSLKKECLVMGKRVPGVAGHTPLFRSYSSPVAPKVCTAFMSLALRPFCTLTPAPLPNPILHFSTAQTLHYTTSLVPTSMPLLTCTRSFPGSTNFFQFLLYVIWLLICLIQEAISGFSTP